MATADFSASHLDFPTLQSIFDDEGITPASCRKILDKGRTAIHQRYQDGVSAAVLIRLQTSLTDFVLVNLWGAHIGVSPETATPAENAATTDAEAALVAVGGYGRGELHPCSDIDLAILLHRDPDPNMQELLGAFITTLWDLGLQIGHSVRTVEDCREQAAADVTVVTNLMEARLLTGSATLFESMLETISVKHMWPSQSYFDAKIEEQQQRREKYHGNAYRLEPNLKESSGGLRDIQTLFWVSQRHFGTREWDDLVTQEILTADEFETLVSGLEFLWKIRYLLHHLSGRTEDRLLFDYQREIAHEFGFLDDNNNQSIEQLMQLYFRHVTRLQYLNEIILQGFGGIISGVTAATEPTPINARFQLRNGFLEVTEDDVFEKYPPAMLEIFIHYSETPEAEKIRARTVRLIQSNLHRINQRFRSDAITRDLFMQIFRTPTKLTRCIRMMSQYGILASYLPAFGKITGRMQYDLFHHYTVDEHTTRVIRNLRRFDLPEADQELPHCSNVMRQIEKPELLYLMGLFHDIAKGRGGDHSELGAVDARKFCQNHGLDAVDTGLVAWGVRHHLIMSTTAQRKDISDPDIVNEFARTVTSLKHLNHLYLLTVADIRGTNPELWNDFKACLLRDLYEATARVLQRGLENPMDSEQVTVLRQQETLERLATPLVSDARLLWQDLADSYFLQYKPHEIERHTKAILAHAGDSTPLVRLHQSLSRGSLEIMIYVPDTRGLFALITTTLDQLNLDIQSASISTTSSGWALDTFYVLEDSGAQVNDQARMEQIENMLVENLSSPDDLPALEAQRLPRRLKHFTTQPRIEYDNSVSSQLTSVFIEASDGPGILSNIARSFMNSGVRVHAAKVVTFGERIEDVFFITGADSEKPLTQSEQAQLSAELVKNLPYD
ncbi:MAG: [protein-PII] uridylyltransferase [Gammaproteobacteria bacterium]|nr:[protein-PII] uridylyltransferase [Gammaproteobacteria bacterium]